MFQSDLVKPKKRRGNIIVMTSVVMILTFGIVAFAIDLGYIATAKQQLQRAADAAAHSAVMDVHDVAMSRAAARDTIKHNPVLGQELQLPDSDIVFGNRTYGHNSETGRDEFGYNWGAHPFNCVKVIARKTEDSNNGSLKLYFANLLGISTADVTAEAITAINPRDIVLVIDISGSMHHDNELWCIPLLDWVVPDVEDGKGAGTLVQEALWDDFELAENNVPMDIVDNPTSEYVFDFTDRWNNQEVELPLLSGRNAQQSRDYYDDQVYGFSTSNCRVDSSGKIMAKLEYNDIRYMCRDSDIYNKWPAEWKDRYAPIDGMVDYIAAYDFITDQYLPKVMPHAKPSLTDADTRDFYRPYWRGYVGYIRGYSSGDGSSSGIEGFSNPTSYYTESHYKDLYRRPDGSRYPGSLQAVMDKLKNHASYASYIQFMLDHANNRHPGRDDDGSTLPDDEQFYSPKQMNKFLAQNNDVDNVYRRWSDDYGIYLPAREFPGSAVLAAALAAVKMLKEQNEGLPTNARDNVALVAFSTDVYPGTGTPTAPFLDSVDDYDELINAVIEASQSIDGATNTMAGLRKAGEWLKDYSRSHTTRVCVLFTDGIANRTSGTLRPISDYDNIWIDLDGDGIEDERFYLGTSSSDPKNAALREVQEIWENNGIVHAITAGVGRDNDVTRRMALLTNGIWQDSGANFAEYAENLIKDFEKLASVRSITFGMER